MQKKQYLLIIAHGGAFTPTEALFADILSWVEKMDNCGVRVYGNPLRPPGEATTVRVRNGNLICTQGPFADSEEKMCAYDLIECATIEEAIDVASQHPMAQVASIEVRPVWGSIQD
jgi:hypothetical protein